MPLANTTLSVFRAASLLLAVCLSACAASSASYVDKETSQGAMVTRGRVTKIENLNSDSLQSLSDGSAITVSKPGCRVTIEFAGKQSQVLELPAGARLVCAGDSDYVLIQTASSAEE
jgi:hypothetical protein